MIVVLLLTALLFLICTHIVAFESGKAIGEQTVFVPAVEAEVRAVCLCEHGINFHEGGTGRCVEVVDNGGWRLPQCKCLSYTGPIPLPSVFAPKEIY